MAGPYESNSLERFGGNKKNGTNKGSGENIIFQDLPYESTINQTRGLKKDVKTVSDI